MVPNLGDVAGGVIRLVVLLVRDVDDVVVPALRVVPAGREPGVVDFAGADREPAVLLARRDTGVFSARVRACGERVAVLP